MKEISNGIVGTIGARTSQTPNFLMRMLLGKRDESICETMKTFEVRALWSMMGMFEV